MSYLLGLAVLAALASLITAFHGHGGHGGHGYSGERYSSYERKEIGPSLIYGRPNYGVGFDHGAYHHGGHSGYHNSGYHNVHNGISAPYNNADRQRYVNFLAGVGRYDVPGSGRYIAEPYQGHSEYYHKKSEGYSHGGHGYHH